MKKEPYSKGIADAIHDFLSKNDWRFSFDRQEGKFEFSASIDGAIQQVRYVVYVQNSGYIVYALPPVSIDRSDKRMIATMAEFICRANLGLKDGNFDLDVSDGSISFKYSVDSGGAIPAQEVVKSSVYCPGLLFECFGGGIAGILFANASAEEAYERCMADYEKKLRTMAAVAHPEGHGDSGANISPHSSADHSKVIVKLNPFATKEGAPR